MEIKVITWGIKVTNTIISIISTITITMGLESILSTIIIIMGIESELINWNME